MARRSPLLRRWLQRWLEPNMVQVSPRRATTNTRHKQPELGMLPWMPRTEGKRLSHCLVGELLNGRNGQLLATTDIERMKETLSAAGLKKMAGVVPLQ